MEGKDGFLAKYGKQDGDDYRRYKLAMEMCQEIDVQLSGCFLAILNLEKRGLIKTKEDTY